MLLLRKNKFESSMTMLLTRKNWILPSAWQVFIGTIDTTDKFYEEENTFMDENTPIITNLAVGNISNYLPLSFRKELKKNSNLLFQIIGM